MEEAAELANYLPLSFKTQTEQEYVEFRWDAFETNYTHGKYQFAFLAYHMLSCCFGGEESAGASFLRRDLAPISLPLFQGSRREAWRVASVGSCIVVLLCCRGASRCGHRFLRPSDERQLMDQSGRGMRL